MTRQQRVLAKACCQSERSDSIVVSFSSRWQDALLDRAFSLVIRKRVPTCNAFRWLYMHMNSPIGAICARAEIRSISRLSLEEAVAHAKEINMSQELISSYVGLGKAVGCYWLGTIQSTIEPITTIAINRRLIYFAPQSFFVLSEDGKNLIDEMAGFTYDARRHHRKV